MHSKRRAVTLLTGIFVTMALLVGQMALVHASNISTQSMNVVRSSGMVAGGQIAAGKVTALTGKTITIKPKANWIAGQSLASTISVSSHTEYLTPTSSSAQDMIGVGSYIVADGVLSADAQTLNAFQVLIEPVNAAGDPVNAGDPPNCLPATATPSTAFTPPSYNIAPTPTPLPAGFTAPSYNIAPTPTPLPTGFTPPTYNIAPTPTPLPTGFTAPSYNILANEAPCP